MYLDESIRVLETLASGRSPLTNNIISDDSVLNERNVIRALQLAIDQLKIQNTALLDVKIDEDDINKTIDIFNEQNIRVSSNNLVGFFLGRKKFNNQLVIENQLYGKFIKTYKRGQLIDFFTEYLMDYKYKHNDIPYKKVDFFQKKVFNHLSDNALNQLKRKVKELGILKTENLSETVQKARKNYPRAYENWSEKEKELLSKALKYTNDLELLSHCFQRAQSSIESCGQKLIYELVNV